MLVLIFHFKGITMQESLSVIGTVSITLMDKDGNIKDQRTFPNLIVTTGKSYITSRIASNATSVIGWIAIGTSSTAAAAGQTALQGTELFRAATTVSGGTPSTSTVLYETTYGPGQGTGTIQEAGLFNAAAAGTMLARTTFAPISKGASDSLNVSWTVTVS